MDLRLNMDEYLPLREVVFKTLRNAIVHGEFEPGERLMEVTLAKRLGVSRTPVRAALGIWDMCCSRSVLRCTGITVLVHLKAL